MKASGRIARKNVRITFQKNEAYSDVYRNRLQRWTEVITCSAYADTYAEQEHGDEVISEEQRVTFETRWCPELAAVTSTGYRVLFRGEIYNILSVDPMNYQKQALRFTCRKETR